eukprot:scaffold11885_cov99-Cylindrotheca_fusiformis.AAC.4
MTTIDWNEIAEFLAPRLPNIDSLGLFFYGQRPLESHAPGVDDKTAAFSVHASSSLSMYRSRTVFYRIQHAVASYFSAVWH